MAVTHIALGAITSYAAAKQLTNVQLQQLLMLGAGVVGSLLPDIDHPRSFLGRRLWFISIPLSNLIGHRGITHSIIGIAAMAAAIWYALTRLNWHPGYSVPIVIGAAIGYISHVVADYCTPSGVPLLWPMDKRFSAPITVQTGTMPEYVITILAAMILWLIY